MARMSRQHFVLIAETLRRYQEDRGQLPPELLERFADALAATNGLFKRGRFLDAARPRGDKQCAA